MDGLFTDELCTGAMIWYTTLHTTAGLLLKLSRVGSGQYLDGRPDAAGSGVGGNWDS